MLAFVRRTQDGRRRVKRRSRIATYGEGGRDSRIFEESLSWKKTRSHDRIVYETRSLTAELVGNKTLVNVVVDSEGEKISKRTFRAGER